MERSERRHLSGKIRTIQNWIGGNDHNPRGADFVPPPPDEVMPLLEDLCNAINDDLLPLSVALAAAKDRYVAGLTSFRGEGLEKWIEHFAAATTKSAYLAQAYLKAVAALTEQWRDLVKAHEDAPKSNAAIWAVLGILPAHPIITAPVATAVTGRAKAAVYEALRLLEIVGVLVPLTTSARNRSWEASGLLNLIEGLEAGEQPEDVIERGAA